MEMQTGLFKFSFLFFSFLFVGSCALTFAVMLGVSCLPVYACGPGSELMVGSYLVVRSWFVELVVGAVRGDLLFGTLVAS